MYADDKYPVPVGVIPKDFFLIGRIGGVAFWIRNVGLDPPYGAGPGQIPE